MSRQRIVSAMILDGTIATADVADRAISNLKLASDVARPSYLVNPHFEIWQRGNGPFATNGWGPDRWTTQQAGGGAGTVTVARDTANAERGVCAAVTYTVGASDAVPGLFQPAASPSEALLAQLRNVTLTTSLRVKTSVQGVRAWGQANGVRVYGTAHPGDGAYRVISVTYTTSGTESTIYAGFEFTVGQGGVAYIDWASLVLGDVPTSQQPAMMHPAEDLLRCQRYYEIIGETPFSIQLGAYTNGGLSYWFPYKVRKPVMPTVTKNGTWATNNANQPTIDHVGLDGCQLTFGALAAGYSAIGNNNVGNTITVEANPT